MLLPTATVLLAGLAAVPPATAPRSLSSGELHRAIERLDVAGSVLYVAAHPDDENTRLLAWLVGAKGLRTTYVSLTRGDGGQNLVGDERGDLLGVLRTRELLAARRIDGAEQRFTRAIDFGYSKTEVLPSVVDGRLSIRRPTPRLRGWHRGLARRSRRPGTGHRLGQAARGERR